MEKELRVLYERVMLGRGMLNYRKIVHLIDKLGEDIPVFVEHLDTHEEYLEASSFIRTIAIKEGINVI